MRVASSPSRCTSTCVCFACELGLPSPPTTCNPSPPSTCEDSRSYMHTLSQTHSSTSSSPPTLPSPTCAARSHARPLCVVLDRCVESGLRSLRPSATRLLRLAVMFCVPSLPHVVRASLRPPLGRAVRRPPASRRRTTRSLRSTWRTTLSGSKARPRWPGRWRSAACSREQR